jgi:hypothetical protein
MKLFAIYARHEKADMQVCFVTISSSFDRAGWPLLHLGESLYQQFSPTRIEEICDAPDEAERIVGFFGPRELNPLYKALGK